jgi:solute carrier family 25 folate transporter 32
MIKLRLQNISGEKSSLGVFREIWQREGFRGLYRGVYPTAAGYLPTWAIYFLVYDATKKWYKTQAPMAGQTFYNVMAALHAGTTSTIITNPLWVVRSKR